MADDFELVTDTLDSHSKALADLADRLRTAVDAANTVSMPTDAYGIICQPFRTMLDPVEQWGLDALKGAADAMDAATTGIKDTAEDYRAIEDSITQAFKGRD